MTGKKNNPSIPLLINLFPWILILLLYVTTSSAHQNNPSTSWDLTYTLIPDESAQIYQLQFTGIQKKADNKLPEKKIYSYPPSYGYQDFKKFIFDNNTYFLTQWVVGAHTFMYRVFHPEKNQGEPICEIPSDGETSKLRLKKNELQVLQYSIFDQPNKKIKASWVPCAQITTNPKKQ